MTSVRANDKLTPVMVREARAALQSAARCSEQPPQWVQAFMSPAGWERYHQLCEEAGHGERAVTARPEPAPRTGGSWFLHGGNAR